MSIQTHLSADSSALTIEILGRFDFSAHHDFRSAYIDRLPVPQRFCVDLAGTVVVDSAALGMLLLLRDHANSHKSTVCIMNANETVSEILDVSCFDRLFEIL